MNLLLVLTVLVSMLVPVQTPAPECKDWQTCRQLALEAAERKDYDAFHDLAWRAMTAGPRNNPELMTLLARAQSLNGRPHDALIMLQRLAAMGVTTDAATSEDFSGVRALPGWADLEAKLAGKEAPPAAAKAGTAPEKPAATVGKPEPTVDKPAPSPPPAPSAPDKPGRNTRTAKVLPADSTPSPLTFSTNGMNPVGLAYDAVSGRFIVGDARDRRLLVIGERSGRVSSLAGVDAGFSEIAALEIDTVEGDLWVVSTSNQPPTATVHKLQLISGRVLSSVAVPREQGEARFADVAVTPQSVLVLDAGGRRVFRVAKKGKTLDLALRLPAAGLSSLAPSSDGTAYVAYDQGLLKVDLATRSMTVVEPGERVDLSGLAWIRWFRGSLVGIQKSAEGMNRVVRIRLDDSGRTARAIEVLDDGVQAAAPTTAGIAGNAVYYLGRIAGTDPRSESVAIRKVAIK
jgi:hypothetical protein